jgi:hypothetical protein
MSTILCKDCRESDPNDKNFFGVKIHCDWYKTYVDPYDTCEHAVKRGYYVSTAICHILGLDENNQVQTAIVNFSKNVLQKNSDTMTVVKQYDKVGPQLATEMLTENNQELCAQLYESYLVPVTNLINQKQTREAINLYKNMVVSLQDYYGLREENENTKENIATLKKIRTNS